MLDELPEIWFWIRWLPDIDDERPTWPTRRFRPNFGSSLRVALGGVGCETAHFLGESIKKQ